jgi:tRNA dimethylallyltransferase
VSAGSGPGPLLFLVGATASGKKRAAQQVAAALGAELLALDSMKVYRGMDLGTDKSAAHRFALTDLVEPNERFSVGAYVRAAALEVAAVRARGRLPLFVGGTGLYLRALVRGLFDVPDIAPEVRRRVAAEIDAHGSAAAHAELARVDPAAAARLHPSDRRRIARAREVFLQTGRSMTAWQEEATRRPIEGRALLVGIRWSRAQLRQRIEARVERMFAAGLLAEVAALRERAAMGPVAGLAIGYREVAALLDAHPELRTAPREDTTAVGAAGREARRALIDACAREIVRDTWIFVRRQDNWLRQFPEIQWIEAESDPASIPERVEAAFRRQLAAQSM